MPLASSAVRSLPTPSASRHPDPSGSREWRLGPAWYDLPELREAQTLFGQAVLARLAPLGLDLSMADGAGDEPGWSRTLLGQTCGYRYVSLLQGQARLVATPRYRTRRAEGPFVRSAVLVRTGDAADGLADLVGRVLAFDARDLGSRNLLRADIAPVAAGRPFFANLIAESSILDAVQALTDGRADAVLIDAVALAHLQRLRPGLASKLRLLSWTSRAPAPPFLTSAKTGLSLVSALRSVLADAVADPALAEVRRELLLEEFVVLPEAHYRALVHFEQMAESQGYPELK